MMIRQKVISGLEVDSLQSGAWSSWSRWL